jgi:hypothetical protein
MTMPAAESLPRCLAPHCERPIAAPAAKLCQTHQMLEEKSASVAEATFKSGFYATLAVGTLALFWIPLAVLLMPGTEVHGGCMGDGSGLGVLLMMSLSPGFTVFGAGFSVGLIRAGKRLTSAFARGLGVTLLALSLALIPMMFAALSLA